jgi:hypothetical protein
MELFQAIEKLAKISVKSGDLSRFSVGGSLFQVVSWSFLLNLGSHPTPSQIAGVGAR